MNHNVIDTAICTSSISKLQGEQYLLKGWIKFYGAQVIPAHSFYSTVLFYLYLLRILFKNHIINIVIFFLNKPLKQKQDSDALMILSSYIVNHITIAIPLKIIAIRFISHKSCSAAAADGDLMINH